MTLATSTTFIVLKPFTQNAEPPSHRSNRHPTLSLQPLDWILTAVSVWPTSPFCHPRHKYRYSKQRMHPTPPLKLVDGRKFSRENGKTRPERYPARTPSRDATALQPTSYIESQIQLASTSSTLHTKRQLEPVLPNQAGNARRSKRRFGSPVPLSSLLLDVSQEPASTQTQCNNPGRNDVLSTNSKPPLSRSTRTRQKHAPAPSKPLGFVKGTPQSDIQPPSSALKQFLQWDEDIKGGNRRCKNDRALARKTWDFMLTPTQLSIYDYLVPSYLSHLANDVHYRGPYSMPPVKDGAWVEVPLAKTVSTKNIRRIIALDCEMVLCGDEHVVALVCAVDFFSRRIVYQKYVAPPRLVTDYITEKSGITPQMLEGVKTTLADVQQELLCLIGDSNTVLIGHALNCDLKALKISHGRVVDTSILFDPPTGPRNAGYQYDRSSLRWLMKTWLGTDIQNGSHDPAIDAVSCIELIRARMALGPQFGCYAGLPLYQLPPYSFHPGKETVPYLCPCPCPSEETWISALQTNLLVASSTQNPSECSTSSSRSSSPFSSPELRAIVRSSPQEEPLPPEAKRSTNFTTKYIPPLGANSRPISMFFAKRQFNHNLGPSAFRDTNEGWLLQDDFLVVRLHLDEPSRLDLENFLSADDDEIPALWF